MARRKPESTPSAEAPEQPSAEERKDKRGHEDGNVRPADGRYGLHAPADEAKYIRTETREQ